MRVSNDKRMEGEHSTRKQMHILEKIQFDLIMRWAIYVRW